MTFFAPHGEAHRGHRSGWLRAAVLGANDGLVSTSSLMVGVATASSAHASAVLTAGLAGLTAGAMAMAAGEWVSVSSQGDVERADVERERRELASQPEAELEELVAIYEERGLSRGLAEQVAQFERAVIENMLRRHHGSAAAASEALGMPKKTFYDKLHRLNLVAEDFR